MADKIKLSYSDPVAGASTLTATVLAIRGSGFFDEVEFFPAEQYKLLGGDVREQFVGFRRIITIDFGVVNDFATQKAILYFLADPDRQLDMGISAPAVNCSLPPILGALSGTYYYRLTAVDAVGESVIGTGDSEIPSGEGVRLTWTDVAGARRYKIYRNTSDSWTSGSLYRATVNQGVGTYDDDGTATTTGIPPASSAFYVALDGNSFSNSWEGNVELGRRYIVKVLERSIRTTWPVA